ncbi:MAG: archease [Thermogutta sp.]
MFEIIDHTADIGLRIQAATLEGLFQEAAEGMFSLLVEDLTAVREETEFPFDVAANEGFDMPTRPHPGESGTPCAAPTRLSDAWGDLLHDWLAQLLVVFDGRRMVFRRFSVRFVATGLHGRAWGERLDPERHRPRMEIKAVTYHELHIARTERGYESRIIFDL